MLSPVSLTSRDNLRQAHAVLNRGINSRLGYVLDDVVIQRIILNN